MSTRLQCFDCISWYYRGRWSGESKDGEKRGIGRHEGKVLISFLFVFDGYRYMKIVRGITFSQLFFFLFFSRREILFEYEQYEYHGTSVSLHLSLVLCLLGWVRKSINQFITKVLFSSALIKKIHDYTVTEAPLLCGHHRSSAIWSHDQQFF